jgi:hypothetical protein
MQYGRVQQTAASAVFRFSQKILVASSGACSLGPAMNGLETGCFSEAHMCVAGELGWGHSLRVRPWRRKHNPSCAAVVIKCLSNFIAEPTRTWLAHHCGGVGVPSSPDGIQALLQSCRQLLWLRLKLLGWGHHLRHACGN